MIRATSMQRIVIFRFYALPSFEKHISNRIELVLKSRPWCFKGWKELLSFRKCACRMCLQAGRLNQHVCGHCWTGTKYWAKQHCGDTEEALQCAGLMGTVFLINPLVLLLFFSLYNTSFLSPFVTQAEGYVIGSCIKHIPIAGRDITYFTQQLLREREVGIPPEQSLETAKAVKVGAQLQFPSATSSASWAVSTPPHPPIVADCSPINYSIYNP